MCDKFQGEAPMGRCTVLDCGVNRELVCRMCQQHWEGEVPPARREENKYLSDLYRRKTLGERVSSLAGAIIGGVRMVGRAELAQRAQICNRCEMLVDSPMIGKECRACGCSMLKLQMESATCPLGKW